MSVVVHVNAYMIVKAILLIVHLKSNVLIIVVAT